jgi:hypothetical protein
MRRARHICYMANPRNRWRFTLRKYSASPSERVRVRGRAKGRGNISIACPDPVMKPAVWVRGRNAIPVVVHPSHRGPSMIPTTLFLRICHMAIFLRHAAQRGRDTPKDTPAGSTKEAPVTDAGASLAVGRPFYVMLAPEERNAGTPPQSKSSAQPGHRSHLLHSNQILSYTISIALVGMGQIGQMSDFLAAVIEEARTPRRTPARTGRAVGRIEHWLLDRGRTSTLSDLRPSPEPPHRTAKAHSVDKYYKNV